MIDDLVTKGTLLSHIVWADITRRYRPPYHDNADTRLTPIGRGFALKLIQMNVMHFQENQFDAASFRHVCQKEKLKTILKK